MYKCFTNPPTGTFNWIGLESCEVVFLNNFRWSPAVIPWEQLLQLCEGADVRINAPKNHCATDRLLPSSRDTPIFATFLYGNRFQQKWCANGERKQDDGITMEDIPIHVRDC